jgi:hypothetical protein
LLLRVRELHHPAHPENRPWTGTREHLPDHQGQLRVTEHQQVRKVRMMAFPDF